MKIPVFFDTEFINLKNGRLSVFGRNLLNLLLDQMQKYLSDDGFVVPSIKQTTQINKLLKMPDGTLIYDKQDNKLKVKINNVFKEISTI